MTPQNPVLDTPDKDRRTMDTPSSSKADPSYYPLDTPRSRRKIQTTYTKLPIIRSRARSRYRTRQKHSLYKYDTLTDCSDVEKTVH